MTNKIIRQTRGDNRMNDLEMQQYLFDLQGYLVIENALSPAGSGAP